MIVSLLLSLLVFGNLGSSVKAASYQVFEDVPVNSPYYHSINSLYAKQAVEGYYSGKSGKWYFKPTKNITRAEASKMIAHTLGLQAYDFPEITFKDVSTRAWYYKSIAALVDKNYLSGFPDNTIRPQATLTRAQMARILVDSYGYEKTTSSLSHFKDVSEDAWYAPYVGALVVNNITSGTSTTTFSPNKAITRQELSALLDRAHNKVSDNNYNDGQIQNLISETQVFIDTIVQFHKKVKPERPVFSEIRDEIVKYATVEFTDNEIRHYYETSCQSCDSSFLFDIPLNYEFYFDILEHSENRITVNTVNAANNLNSGYFVEVSLVKEHDQWKMDSYETTTFEERPLDISVEEAKEHLLNLLPRNNYVSVESLEYVTFDPTRNWYVFDLVTTDNKYNKAYFNPNTAYYWYD
jgi:hypothetical protein